MSTCAIRAVVAGSMLLGAVLWIGVARFLLAWWPPRGSDWRTAMFVGWPLAPLIGLIWLATAGADWLGLRLRLRREEPGLPRARTL